MASFAESDTRAACQASSRPHTRGPGLAVLEPWLGPCLTDEVGFCFFGGAFPKVLRSSPDFRSAWAALKTCWARSCLQAWAVQSRLVLVFIF